MPQEFQDAQSALGFITEQLREQETEVYTARYPNFEIADHIDVVTTGNRWATGTTFFSMDGAGETKWIGGKTNDIPFVSIDRSRYTRDYHIRGGGYEINLVEVNRARMLNIPIEAEKMSTVRQAMEIFKYNVCMTGDTEKNWTGLVNSSEVGQAQVPNDGTGSARTFASKTPDQVSRDINVALRTVQSGSNEVEWADSLRLPPTQFADIATRKYAAGDGTMTILDFVKKNNVYTAETGKELDIKPMRSLVGVGQSGSDRMFVYRKDKSVVRFHLPGPLEFLAPHVKSLMAFEVGGLLATGGTEWRLPGAARYFDGV